MARTVSIGGCDAGRESDGLGQMSDFAYLRALIFDVDGTLYRLGPVRRKMFVRLLGATLRNPGEGLKTMRTLRSYRRAHEVLRVGKPQGMDLDQAQRQLAAQWSHTPAAEVDRTVTRWMEEEPLDVIPTQRYDGLVDVLQEARKRGLARAVVSDYPAQRKLAALGLAEYFEHVICAQDASVQNLKPHPRGLEVAMARLGVGPHEVMYVGDRAEVDGACAARAGAHCAILGPAIKLQSPGEWTPVSNYQELASLLWAGTGYPVTSGKGMELA